MKGPVAVILLIAVIVVALGAVIFLAFHKPKPSVTNAAGAASGGARGGASNQMSSQPVAAD